MRDYAQTASSIIEGAKQPFHQTADLLSDDFKLACEQLDLVEDCLRKICELANSAVHILGVDTITRITSEATNIIEAKEEICHYLSEKQLKLFVHNHNILKREIRKKFDNFIERLDEFQQKLPEANK